MLFPLVVEKEYMDGPYTCKLLGVIDIEAPTEDEAKEQLSKMMERLGEEPTLSSLDPRIKWQPTPDEDERKWEYVDWSFVMSDEEVVEGDLEIIPDVDYNPDLAEDEEDDDE